MTSPQRRSRPLSRYCAQRFTTINEHHVESRYCHGIQILELIPSRLHTDMSRTCHALYCQEHTRQEVEKSARM
eukprot:1326009-Amorphochlora_amoeboformis.AAC.2